MKDRALVAGVEVILLTLLLGLFSHVSATTTTDRFRCPNGVLISVNDKIATVRLRCDPPDSITTRSVTEGSADYFYTVDVEEWMYNQGPTSFIYYLTFKNGILRKIEIGEYGR